MYFIQSWYRFVRDIVDKLGISIESLNNYTVAKSKSSVLNKLKDISGNVIMEQLRLSSKLQLYVSYKTVNCIEPYLAHIQDAHLRKIITMYRISAHKLPIEVGRYSHIDRNERVCKFCKSSLGDENHCLLRCFHPTLTDLRNTYLNTIYEINPALKVLPRDCLLLYILSFKDVSIMNCTAKYIAEVYNLH